MTIFWLVFAGAFCGAFAFLVVVMLLLWAFNQL